MNDALKALIDLSKETESETYDCPNHASYWSYDVDMNSTTCKRCGRDEDSAPGTLTRSVPTKTAKRALQKLKELGVKV